MKVRQGVADTVHGAVNCFMHGIFKGEFFRCGHIQISFYSSIYANLQSQDTSHICLSALPIMTSSRNTATCACGKSRGFSFQSPYWIKNSVSYFRFLKFSPPFFLFTS